MFPTNYLLPIAGLLVLGGLLACFFGYRLFRIVLGVYGFYFGAMVTTQFMAPTNTWALVLAGVVGGLVGAVLMVAAYFIGVGLVGAFLAALVLNAGWRFVGGDPPTLVLVIVCVIGALAALSIQRWVVIFGTAIAGSWTLIVGALALMGDAGAMRAASAGDVWVLYPLDPLPTRWWLLPAWLVIALVGVIVQIMMKGPGPARRKAKGAE
jgi:hypothetical protein